MIARNRNNASASASHIKAVDLYNSDWTSRQRYFLELWCPPHLVWIAENRVKLAVKLIQNVEFVGNCVVWTGPTSGEGHRGAGYGRMTASGKTAAVHRVSYTLAKGWIAPHKQIDHLCGNRACCNPMHLQAVTHKQNQRRRRKSMRTVNVNKSIDWELANER